MKIEISKKERFNYFIAGLILIIAGFGIIFILNTQNSFIIVFSKLIAIVSIIYGIILVNAYDKTRQAQNITFSLKNNTLTINNNSFKIEPNSLLLNTKRYFKYIVVSIFNKNHEPIYKDIVFETKEFMRFKEMLSLYLINKSTNISQAVTLFDKGFTIDGKEFIYDEIEQLDGSKVDTGANTYIDIYFTLKDGKTHHFRITTPLDNQAKALYIIYKKSGKRLYCTNFPKISATLFIIAFITGVWAYIKENEALLLWMIGLGLWMFYRVFEYFEENNLCKKFEELSPSNIGSLKFLKNMLWC